MPALCTLVVVGLVIGAVSGCHKEARPAPSLAIGDRVVYRCLSAQGVPDYALSAKEGRAIVRLLVSHPTGRFTDEPILPVHPLGQLTVGGKERYYLFHGGYVRWTYREGRKETGYYWDNEQVKALCIGLSDATAVDGIHRAFGRFGQDSDSQSLEETKGEETKGDIRQ